MVGDLQVDPTYHTHFSYIAVQVNSAYQRTSACSHRATPPPSSEFFLSLVPPVVLPGGSLVLFDEEGNFIHDASDTKKVRDVPPAPSGKEEEAVDC